MSQPALVEPLAEGLGKWVVYALIDPRDNATHYIGRTSENSARLRSYANPSAGVGNRRLQSWLRDLRESGLGPCQVQILQRCASFDDVEAAEVAWINRGRAAGWPLANRHGKRAGGAPREVRRARWAAKSRQHRERFPWAKIEFRVRHDWLEAADMGEWQAQEIARNAVESAIRKIVKKKNAEVSP